MPVPIDSIVGPRWFWAKFGNMSWTVVRFFYGEWSQMGSDAVPKVDRDTILEEIEPPLE